ncbi:hypothetical protein BaRGS_00033388 [Batillaria attramentaria]|uniref:Uncharacterized protein n=1 Tax=Batillaria attramentaria TaxID=370345 RepID=A0ABD0JK94_9CAEN
MRSNSVTFLGHCIGEMQGGGHNVEAKAQTHLWVFLPLPALPPVGMAARHGDSLPLPARGLQYQQVQLVQHVQHACDVRVAALVQSLPHARDVREGLVQVVRHILDCLVNVEK